MKKLFILMLALGVVACKSGDEQKALAPAPVTEGFDSAMEVDYRLGYENDDMLFDYFENEEYGYWGGFVQSKMFDLDPANGLYENQYSAFNSGAASGDSFLLYYYDSFNEPCDIICKKPLFLQSVKLNLTTYTYASITNEDINAFARMFDEGDYLKVIFTPYVYMDGVDTPSGQSVECYVVDYRDGKRFVADDWQKFDLNISAPYRVRVAIETTDVGEWGANTPLYICMDDLTYKLQ